MDVSIRCRVMMGKGEHYSSILDSGGGGGKKSSPKKLTYLQFYIENHFNFFFYPLWGIVPF